MHRGEQRPMELPQATSYVTVSVALPENKSQNQNLCMSSGFVNGGTLVAHLSLDAQIAKSQLQRFEWATPPVRLGLSGRNSGKIPEILPGNALRAFPGSSPHEYGWDAPSPIIQGI